MKTIFKTRQTPEAIGNNVKEKARRISKLLLLKSLMMLLWKLRLFASVKPKKPCWLEEKAVVMTRMMILSLARKRSKKEGRRPPLHSRRTIGVINVRARKAARISSKPRKRKKKRQMKRAKRLQQLKSLKKSLTMQTMTLRRRRNRKMKVKTKSKAQR